MIQFLFIAASLLIAALAVACVYLYKRNRNLQQSELQSPVRPYPSPEMVAEDDISVTGNLLCDNHQIIVDNLMEYFEREKPYLKPNVKILEIADAITKEAHRGVTAIHSEGWYTHTESEIVTVVARKQESSQILRIIKKVDDTAFVSVSNVSGVFGKGFEQIKK